MITAVALGAAVIVLGACEKTNRESMDRWMDTQKGPDKLEKSLSDTSLSADLRAHAARNLFLLEESGVRLRGTVVGALEAMAEGERQAVVGELVRELWADARMETELSEPSPIQASAKDALFELRKYASGDTLQEIDDHLIDWFTGGYYSGLANRGRYRGALIMRTIGQRAAPKLLANAKSVVGAPPDKEGRQPVIEETLLV
ncbi:MAG: hypothetical protein AAGC55_30940, partial [Myxococcota bacterium]